MEAEENRPEGGAEGSRKSETSTNYFQITIPFGIKYEEKWLLNLLQSHCSVPFIPFQFHYEKMQAQFLVENARAAFTLRNLSGQLCDKDNEKINIFVSPFIVSPSVWDDLKSGRMSMMQLSPTTFQHRDQFQRLGARPKTTITKSLGPSATEVKVVARALFERKAKSKSQFVKVKGLQPQGRRADSSLPHTALPEQSTSIRYYWIFDYGDRQSLLNAYHDSACFSLTTAFNPEDPDPSGLEKYSQNSRNMMKIQDPVSKVQMLKHTKGDIVETLRALPKTEHDLTSFLLDVNFCKWTVVQVWIPLMAHKTIRPSLGNAAVGVISQAPVRAFFRTFIVIPATGSNLSIVNDQLFVRDISFRETRSAISATMPMAASHPVSTLSKEQQEMVQKSPTQFGTGIQWSQK
ncbi:nuclear RNA export factor 3-like [Rhynchocyon petersi]